MSTKDINTNQEDNNFEFLDSISKKDEFIVPEGYFDKMKNDISLKTNRQVVQGGNRFKKVLYSISIAAAIALGVFIFTDNSTEECITYACLLEETILTDSDIEYIEEGSDVFFEDVEDSYLY